MNTASGVAEKLGDNVMVDESFWSLQCHQESSNRPQMWSLGGDSYLLLDETLF